jgi:DNA-binding transcriptional LysR family regulator
VAHPLPYLAYAPGAYMGRAVEQMLKQSTATVHLDRIYETDMAEGLKAMALEGHGVAFLPASAVRRELRAKRLVSAGQGLDTALDIRIYRERPGIRKAKGSVDAFWNDLEKHLAAQTKA